MHGAGDTNNNISLKLINHCIMLLCYTQFKYMNVDMICNIYYVLIYY